MSNHQFEKNFDIASTTPAPDSISSQSALHADVGSARSEQHLTKAPPLLEVQFRSGGAGEILDKPTELKKPDGSIVKLEGGLVTEVTRGDNRVSITYQRDGNNRVQVDSTGKPLVATIKTGIAGAESTIDLSPAPGDQGLPHPASRITVVQNGDKIGNIITASEDWRQVSTLHTDFRKTTHEIVNHNGKELSRLAQVRRADGSTITYGYNDPTRPDRVSQIVEQSRTALGLTLTQTSNRIGDTEKFITQANNSNDVRWRTNVKISDDDSLAYKELITNFFDGPSEYSDLNLDRGREEFINTATTHGVFKGDRNKILNWMDKFERRQAKFRDKGWQAASAENIAESYRNLARVFTDQPRGNATRVTFAERRLAVETALKELADPIKYINQGPVGTCGINSVEDAIAQRRPQDLTRWIREAITTGQVTSRSVDKHGKHRVVQLGANQIKYQPTYHRTYSNQLFQFAGMAALGYKDSGHGYPGTTSDQMKYLSKLAGGNDLKILDNWMGRGAKKQQLIKALEKGSVGYIVPGHAMAIVDYDAKRDRFLVNNWWGGDGDGWYDARRLRLS